MTAKWLAFSLTSKRTYLNSPDSAPVNASETSKTPLPLLSHAKISHYESPFVRSPSYTYCHASSDRNTLHIASIVCDKYGTNADAVGRASKQAWIDICARDSIVIDEVSASAKNIHPSMITTYLNNLDAMLYDVARSSLSYHHVAVSINHTEKSLLATVSQSLSQNLLLLHGDLSITCLNPTFNQPQCVDISNIKALIIAPQSKKRQPLEKAIKELSETPYPVEGAAELAHFALADVGHASDFVWVELFSE